VTKLENNEIVVKDEMHDYDDEPLNKVIKLNDISCKEEPVKIKTEEELEEERVLNYIENRLKPNFPWVELSDGKLFCKVRNI